MVMIKFLAYYAIPLIIITFFYILMAHHLVLSTRNMPGEMQGQSTQIRARKKVAKMVLAFVIIFILCFLPYHIFNLWFHFDPRSEEVYDEFWNAFRIIGFCLSFINSCINPITLYCVSGTFRKYFNRYLFCCCTDARGRRSLSRRGDNATICENSSHTLVHFNSTVRRHCPQLQDINCSVTSTHTTVFNLDKTWKWAPRVSGGKRRQLHIPHGNSHQFEVQKSCLNSEESSHFLPKRTTTVTFKTWSKMRTLGEGTQNESGQGLGSSGSSGDS